MVVVAGGPATLKPDLGMIHAQAPAQMWLDEYAAHVRARGKLQEHLSRARFVQSAPRQGRLEPIEVPPQPACMIIAGLRIPGTRLNEASITNRRGRVVPAEIRQRKIHLAAIGMRDVGQHGKPVEERKSGVEVGNPGPT